MINRVSWFFFSFFFSETAQTKNQKKQTLANKENGFPQDVVNRGYITSEKMRRWQKRPFYKGSEGDEQQETDGKRKQRTV